MDYVKTINHLLKELKTKKEIQKYLRWGKIRLSDFIKDNKIEFKPLNQRLKDNLPKELTDFQESILVGSMLGDGSINQRDAVFRFTQSAEKSDYVSYLHSILIPFVTATLKMHKRRKPTRIGTKVFHDLEHWKGGYCFSCHFNGKREIPVFRQLQKKWYPEGKKIVPTDLKLDAISVAHWYWQDGNNNKGIKTITLATDSFTKDEVLFLIERLKKDVGIISRIGDTNRGTYHIRIGNGIGTEGYFPFIELIKEHYHGWKCFRKKIDIEGLPRNEDISRTEIKLSKEKANKIRELHATGNFTQRHLAQEFGISFPHICRLLQGHCWN